MKRLEIQKGLVKQLECKGANSPYSMSLVEDYMFLHDQVQKMKTSIRKNGAQYEAVSAAGKKYMKENPAVKNIVLYNRQMLAILKELDLSAEWVGGEGDDEL